LHPGPPSAKLETEQGGDVPKMSAKASELTDPDLWRLAEVLEIDPESL
jgi:hypothetical protein